MRLISDFKKGESGQVLVYVTIIVALAALIITPILHFTYAGHQSARVREERTLELYAADSGIEDAMYQIKNADPLNPNDPIVSLNYWNNPSFTIGSPQDWNDRDLDVTVEKIWIPGEIDDPNIVLDAPTTGYYAEKLPTGGLFTNVEMAAAEDKFESGGWSGGTGWDAGWTHTGSASIVSGIAQQGTYALSFTDSTGLAKRSTELLGFYEPRLKFYANAGSFEDGDTAVCQVSLDGTNWDTVRTWANGDDTGEYQLIDTNLTDIDPDYGNATDFWIAFQSNAVGGIVASDDFTSGGWSGGTGWAGNWVPTGSASVATTGVPLSAPYHLKLISTGKAVRVVNLSAAEKPRLRFWAKANSFGSSDRAYLKVSTNGSTWTTIRTWSASQSYTYYDIDLSSYQGAGNLWISFEGSMTSAGGTVASDNFESGGWSGGSGWAGSWSHSGDTAIVTGWYHSSPYSLRLRYNTGVAQRAANISDYDAPRLQFWARAYSFETGDIAYCYVASSGSGPWYEVKRWTASQSYTYWDIALPPEVSGASTVWVRFQSAMNSTGDYLYIDDLNIVDRGRFYVDDMSIAEGDHFYVDDLWIGSKVDIYTLEVAYTDILLGDVFMDRLAVWLPPGVEYIGVVDSFGIPQVEPTHIVPSFADGTVVQWDFSPTINLALPVGAEGLPIVRSLSFTFTGGEEDQGMFAWMRAHKGGGELCLSWDTGYSLYRTTSQASHEIWGTNTKVEAYVGQGELNKRGLATYGNYVATGNPLLIDYTGSAYVKEKRIDPATPSTWVTKDGFYYDGRSDVTDLPADSEMIAAWLYWSAFVRNSEWSAPDETVDFMFPKYYTESFDVSASPYTTQAKPIVNLPEQPKLYLYPLRHCGEELGTAYIGDGNNTFLTDFKPVLSSPVPKVWAGATLLVAGTDYTIAYSTGNVTIINDARSGLISIDYSVADSQTLVEGVDYTLNRTTGLVTIIRTCLAGTVIINYWAETWQAVQHNADNEYGMALPPAQTEVPLTAHVGHSYACFYDATQLLRSSGINGVHPGAGQYAVRNITSTQGVDGTEYATRCFSGWSLIILYRSASETAHQFYLYDPIHKPDECPFMMIPSTDPPYEDPHDEFFSLKDFYPPAGSVQGRVTYFVGEGDVVYDGDYIQFKGATQPSYTTLAGPNNPATNVMNTVSTTGERGIDIDTYDILSEVGSDTEADIRLVTRGDRWYLIYMILSFKTSVVPKADYAFNVAAITYSYELGTLGQ